MTNRAGVERKVPSTTPVRISNDLLGRVARLADDNKRKIRAQVELLIERGMSVLDEDRFETRKGVRRGS